MKDLPRLQYVTHPNEQYDDLTWVHRLHEGGVRWIQLRLKEEDVYNVFPDVHYLAFFHEIADRMRAVTGALGMLLTINDHPEVALFSNADGFHIGQEDQLPEKSAFNESVIIGGTANSFQEMKRYLELPFTYFGVGPLRDTTTKSSLKPVLGLEGYRRLLLEMQQANIDTPVVAIGGVIPSDIRGLLENGVQGVAVSGALFHKGHAVEVIKEFTNEIERYESENCR